MGNVVNNFIIDNNYFFIIEIIYSLLIILENKYFKLLGKIFSDMGS